MSDKRFLQDVLRISIPVALQSMLQSSFSMVLLQLKLPESPVLFMRSSLEQSVRSQES